MTITPFDELACPLDGAALTRVEGSWRCPAGHGFDIARQGYTHLLPVQHKRSRDPGDSRDMVAARQRFLNAGFYAPIAASVSRLALRSHGLSTAAGGEAPLRCLDAGCGEGYYLRQLAQAAGPERALALLGLDISKWAVQAAARQQRQVRWVVGSNANLPVPDQRFDLLLCLFGFPVHSEFARVLRPGGHLLQVDAGPDHLRELREIIYPQLKPARAGVPLPEGFDAVASETLAFTLRLPDAAAIADLLVMTPHLYRASAEGRQRAAELDALTLSVDVRLSLLRRR